MGRLLCFYCYARALRPMCASRACWGGSGVRGGSGRMYDSDLCTPRCVRLWCKGFDAARGTHVLSLWLATCEGRWCNCGISCVLWCPYPLESHVWKVLQVASLTHVHVCSLNLAIAALCTLFPLGFASEAHRAHLLPSLCPPMQRCHWAQTCSAHLALL